ncbi:hypothetical protein, partial [Aliivibrio fischeri]|uniref:hypothetical protein n=1 Tax=Aliivibrio fischeri TaxID=668 RepID=UPI001BE419A6
SISLSFPRESESGTKSLASVRALVNCIKNPILVTQYRILKVFNDQSNDPENFLTDRHYQQTGGIFKALK